MNKPLIRIGSLLAILAVVAWLVISQTDLFRSASNTPTTLAGSQAAAAAPEANLQNVIVKVLKPERVLDVLTVTGTVEPDESVVLTSEIAGKVLQIAFQEGRFVKAGALLVKLDDAELQAQKQRVSYELELAQQVETRREQLVSRGGVSQEEYDEARTSVNTLKAELALLDVQIEKTEIRAPFTGRIGFRYVSGGSYLSPGTNIAELYKVDPVKIAFPVPEIYSRQLKPGTPVSYTLDGSDDSIDGSIYALAPAIDPDTRSQMVKARSRNPGGKVTPGSFASVRIQLAEYAEALMVPAQTVVPELGGQKVFLYQNGQAVSRQVITGLRQADAIQLTTGVSPGDTLITTGALKLRDGTPVRIEKFVE
jgi:membrane fusion protein, multidrug efflux system